MRWVALFQVSWQRYLPGRSLKLQDFEGNTYEIMGRRRHIKGNKLIPVYP